MSFGWLALLTLIQAQPQRLAFDVASLKRAAPITTDSYSINLGKTNRGELTMGNVTLGECLKFAYGLTDDIQLAGPEWMRAKGDILFDIVAKAPADTSRERLLLMLQSLLTERFQLVLRREQRQASYLALVQSKKGLKIATADPAAGLVNNTFHLGHIDSKSVYMPALATVLSRFMRHPVLDLTGLAGRFMVKLDWTPDSEDPIASGAEPVGTAPSIYTAIEQQLGLKLESRKGPLEVIVVDHAERVPISN